MFGISGFELFIILLFGFLIFGPDKLPEIAKTVGKGIAKFRNAQQDMSEQLKNATLFDKDSDEPFKNPIDVMDKAAQNAKANVKKANANRTNSANKSESRSEGFAERKARYEKERAARKAAEKERPAEKEKPAGAGAKTQSSKAEAGRPVYVKPSVATLDDIPKNDTGEASAGKAEADPSIDVPEKTITEVED